MVLLSYLLLALPILLEPFPISSSSHALLLEKAFNTLCGAVIDIPAYYDHVLHGPIVIVLILFFWQEWLLLIRNNTVAAIKTMFLAGVITEIITVVWYILFSKIGTNFLPLSLGFFISSCLLFSLLFCKQGNDEQLFDVPRGFFFGMAQGIALLPGISRFGATFVTARWLRFSPQKSFLLSFLIEVPISLAGFFKGFYQMSLVADNQNELLNLPSLLVILITMVGAYKGFCIIQYIIEQHKIWLFGCYVFMLSLSVFFAKFF